MLNIVLPLCKLNVNVVWDDCCVCELCTYIKMGAAPHASSTYLSIYLPIHLSIYIINLSIYLSICPPLPIYSVLEDYCQNFIDWAAFIDASLNAYIHTMCTYIQYIMFKMIAYAYTCMYIFIIQRTLYTIHIR